MKNLNNIFFMLKILVFTYVLSFIMIGILAFIVYKTQCSDTVSDWGIIAIYFLSAFSGGMLAGKIRKSKRLIWGVAAGILYAAVLIAVSAIMGNVSQAGTETAILLAAATLGGASGGMIS